MRAARSQRAKQLAEFARIYQGAIEAGHAALAPTLKDMHWGCGSAIVCVNGNFSFGRWVVREKGWEARTRGVGLSISFPLVPREVWQSENHKAVFARAFASVLKAAGIDAWVDTWSD